MEEAIKYLSAKDSKYSKLLSRYKENGSEELAFEILFAYQMEQVGDAVQYEVSVNADSQKTVDFQVTANSINLNIELFRVGVNKGIKELQKQNELTGYVLSSDAKEEDFRTAAQIIKLQWGILEKVEKFGEPSESNVNIICIDCSNVHAGMLDCHDVAITMWGKPYASMWVERWDGERICGMLEDDYDQKRSDLLKSHISAVIFIPKLKWNPLNAAFVAFNNLLDHEHLDMALTALQAHSAFTDIGVCRRPSGS